jgi:2-phosphosulfolactate phosphatase
LHAIKAVVIVDVLRSSSTIITALSNGAKSVIPFTNVSKAIKAHRAARLDTILAGERNGVTPTHFDYNISPFEVSRENISGKTILYSSSNLTRVLDKLGKRHRIFLGAIINARAMADYLQGRHENVVIVACGTKLGTAVEDLVGAGAIAASLADADFSDEALAVIGLFRSKGWKGLVKQGRVANRLIELGFERDIEFCLRLSSSSVVPGLVGHKIIDVRRSGKSR